MTGYPSEVEVKYRVSCQQLQAIRDALQRLNLKPIGLFEEVDDYYAHPCKDLMASDEALRVRSSGGRVTLTYKGPRYGLDFKERVEVNVEVLGDISGLLELLGFRKALSVRKLREYFDGGNIQVTLDVVDELGCFVEVEAKGVSVEMIRDIIAKLGLPESSRVDETYAEMLLKRVNRTSS